MPAGDSVPAEDTVATRKSEGEEENDARGELLAVDDTEAL